jgi:hypothetical protein
MAIEQNDNHRVSEIWKTAQFHTKTQFYALLYAQAVHRGNCIKDND